MLPSPLFAIVEKPQPYCNGAHGQAALKQKLVKIAGVMPRLPQA
jgi:hypothetical protein